MDVSWSSTLLTSLTSLGCKVHLPACLQAKLAFSSTSRRYASPALLRAWMASLVKRISTNSLHSSLTSLAKGAKGIKSWKEVWSFLISWRAVRHFDFLEGSLVFATWAAVPLNSFLGHFLAAVGSLSLATEGGVPEMETVSVLSWGTESSFSSQVCSFWLRSSWFKSVGGLTVAS